MTNPKHISEVLNVVREDIERKRRPATWKAVEREVAKRLGGQRVGVTGRATADVVTSTLNVEVKTRKTLPKWLKNALAQATNGADGRLPVVVIHEIGQRHADDLVLVRLSDFEGLCGIMNIEHPF